MPEVVSYQWLRKRSATLWRRIAMVTVLLGVLLALYWPVQAAMELMFFRAQSTDTSVLLSWATAREIDVEGFLILCKMQGEPDSAYHWIGQRAAMGGPNQGAEYEFAVTEGVYYGEQYCFRLEEVTTNEEPGEIRDICGYGPGVTPTPAVEGSAVAVLGSLTPIVVTPVPGQSPAPTLITPGPTPTWTPIGQSPLSTLSAAPTVTATSTQFGSPLGTPTPLAGAAGFGGPATPTFLPSPTATATATSTPSATPTQPVSPLGALPAQDAVPPSTMPDASLAAAAGGGAALAQQSASDLTGVQATPTAAYIVVTATPTPQALAVVPTLTALPTATVVPNMGLFNVLEPTAQSMMVMMLCLIFLSATGLGTLGLVTAVLFFRSQSQRRTDSRAYIDQRRF